MSIDRKKEEKELTAAGQIFKTEKDGSSSSAQDTKNEGKAPKEPSQKDAKSKTKEKDQSQLKEIIQFFKEVRQEFFKISWPDLPQVMRETLSVLVLVAAITLMVLAFDWFLANAIFGPLEHWARLHGGGVGPG